MLGGETLAGEIRVWPYRWAFAAPVATARGVFTHREGYLVTLRTPNGGWTAEGDAAPWPGFSADFEHAHTVLRRAAAAGALSLGDFRAMTTGVVEAASALDQAACQIASVQAGVRLCDLPRPAALGGDAGHTSVPVHALVNSPEQAEAAVARGHRTLKIKIGLGDVTRDVARVSDIRSAVGPGVALRLDANGAYPNEAALRACERFQAFTPEFIEQPSPHLADCARVRRLLGVAVALDESIVDAASVAEALAAGAMDVAILKPAFLPSRWAALELAATCRAANVGVVVTCALESAVGRRAALHLAASLPGPPPAAGLLAAFEAGADDGTFPVVENGCLLVDTPPGWRPTGSGDTPPGKGGCA